LKYYIYSYQTIAQAIQKYGQKGQYEREKVDENLPTFSM